MGKSNTLLPLPLLLLPIFFHSLSLGTLAQPSFLSYLCLRSSFADSLNNYTSNSTYKANLNTVLSSISTDTHIDYGFYNFSVGKSYDKVNAIALCRGDVTLPQCHACLNDAIPKIKEQCPSQREAIGWYDNCMLRYSNRNIFGEVELDPYFNETSPADLADDIIGAKYNQTLGALLSKVQNKTAFGDSRLKFATEKVNVSDTYTLYTLMQCTPDLQAFDCFNCLEAAITRVLPKCCAMKEGARVVFPSCSIRYENYLFYNESNAQGPPLLTITSSPPPSLPLAPPTFLPPSINTNDHRPGSGKTDKSKIVVITVVALAVVSSALVALISCFLLFLRRRRRKEIRKKVTTHEDEIPNVESLQMDIGTIRAATGNFSEESYLGSGGFGEVYKGKLSNGREIAVKRLSKDSGQGELQFKNEVILLAKLQHRNLVRLLGFCLEGAERLLIYEFLPNQSLDYHLFDPVKQAYLNWKKRYNIIQGIARGLLYLHEDSRLLVIHRDLNASNILLDDEMNPKISDFGMARQFQLDQTHGDTTKIVGTYGYMPPEYAMHGKFSIKTDVFSFGVLVLEIISGEKISSFCNVENGESLLGFAWRNWLEGTALNLMDPKICTPSTTEVLRCINIALLCVQENVAHRPIMSSVALMLSSSSITLQMPSRPAFLLQTGLNIDAPLLQQSNGSDESGDSNHQVDHVSANECSVSELYPR
ncbi:hypothetical protein Dimus_032218 [Dionaea muscipula]